MGLFVCRGESTTSKVDEKLQDVTQEDNGDDLFTDMLDDLLGDVDADEVDANRHVSKTEDDLLQEMEELLEN